MGSALLSELEAGDAVYVLPREGRGGSGVHASAAEDLFHLVFAGESGGGRIVFWNIEEDGVACGVVAEGTKEALGGRWSFCKERTDLVSAEAFPDDAETVGTGVGTTGERETLLGANPVFKEMGSGEAEALQIDGFD